MILVGLFQLQIFYVSVTIWIIYWEEFSSWMTAEELLVWGGEWCPVGTTWLQKCENLLPHVPWHSRWKRAFCGLLKLPDSIFKDKQANKTQKAFLALTTSRLPLAAPFAHRRYNHHGIVLLWRTTSDSDVATKILSKKRKMAAVSAPSCRRSKLSRDQNNGFNITSTLCPPACLLPPFLPCAVVEVICLLGTKKHCSRPGSKVWDLRHPLEQLSSILGCHPRL